MGLNDQLPQAAAGRDKSPGTSMPLIVTTKTELPRREDVPISKPVKSTTGGTARDVMLMTNKWNEKYAADLADGSPGGLRSMNRGVSHLVAPLSYATNPSI